MISKQQILEDKRYLDLLAKEFPNIQAASTEIINLQAILNLPKGTEHFMSDIHGEADAFLHILNNASGVIKEKIDLVYSNMLSQSERKALAALIYYPELKISEVKETEGEMEDWYRITLNRLIEVCSAVTSKYTRSKVRKALPKDFEYIIDELLHTNYAEHNKEQYYENIISTIIDIDRSEEFIIALANLIKRMAVDRLHIVGDIFDRGPRADMILDRLLQHHSVDIQWGNHDVLWMGAASGSRACIATVLRNSLAYNNLDIIENSYGINLLPLAMLASEVYGDASAFAPKNLSGNLSSNDVLLIQRMHKAIFVIQQKLEAQLIARRPEFHMEDRAMINRIDFSDMTIELEGKKYPLKDKDFPTVDPKNPSALTEWESSIMDSLESSFTNSEKLQRHVRFLYKAGSLYKCFNGNLLFHGSMPCDETGEFISFVFDGWTMKGKEFFDFADATARQGFYEEENTPEKDFGMDFLWFLWCGRNSPVFGRDRITTFERALIDDPEVWTEPKNPYYKLADSPEFCDKVLTEFGLGTTVYNRIINGHVPVKVKEGEGPVKAGGKHIVIDGGFCKAYQQYTGIAGYTMFFSSHGIRIAAHQPFESKESAIMYGKDISSTTVISENLPERLYVGATDTGREIQRRIDELKSLLQAFRLGIIKEADGR